MGYKKGGRDARAEERELHGQHSFFHRVLVRLHMIRDTEGNKPRRTNVTPLHFVYCDWMRSACLGADRQERMEVAKVIICEKPGIMNAEPNTQRREYEVE